MKTNTGLIVGLVVSVLLAAVFAVLWFGAYEDIKLLTRQVNYLTHQLEGNFSLLQKIAQQLAETQKQLQDTQNQLRETQERLQDTSNQLKDTQARLAETQRQLQAVQNQLEQTQNQLKDAQAQLSEVKAQLALLKTLMSSIISATTQKKTVYIGAALPLTGGLQYYGISAKNAIELAVEDANKMCPNFEFKLLVEDTGTDPQKALQKVLTLYAKGARLIVGPMSSREVSAVKSFADQNKILIFSPSSTSPLLAIPGDWVYRIVPTDFAQAMAIADLLKYLGVKRAVIIYRNDAWGLGLSNAIANESKKLGIQIVASAGYDPDPKAFPTAVPEVIRKLSAALGQPGSDAAIIFVTFEDDGIAAVQAAAQDPVLSKVRWIGTDGIAYSEAMIKQVGKEMAASKMLGTIAAPDPNDPKYQQFKQAYKAKYGKDPVAYDPYGYDAAMILMQIVCAVGTDDPVKVKETLEQWGKEGKYQGATGKVYLDAAGDRAYPNYVIWGVVLEGGTPKYIDAAYYYGTDRKIVVFYEGRSLFWG
jgi:branched-chain amino acid transport system substrate-binding protein